MFSTALAGSSRVSATAINLWTISKRMFSDIGKFKIGDLDKKMQKFVQKAAVETEKLDPSVSSIQVRGQLHDSTTVPGTKSVTVRCFKDTGSHWGTFHVDEQGRVAYSYKALQALASAELQRSGNK